MKMGNEIIDTIRDIYPHLRSFTWSCDTLIDFPSDSVKTHRRHKYPQLHSEPHGHQHPEYPMIHVCVFSNLVNLSLHLSTDVFRASVGQKHTFEGTAAEFWARIRRFHLRSGTEERHWAEKYDIESRELIPLIKALSGVEVLELDTSVREITWTETYVTWDSCGYHANIFRILHVYASPKLRWLRLDAVKWESLNVNLAALADFLEIDMMLSGDGFRGLKRPGLEIVQMEWFGWHDSKRMDVEFEGVGNLVKAKARRRGVSFSLDGGRGSWMGKS
ncbi:hypothetical protein BC829DRAFT_126398 [Chytridium lagenaria]|nr:hypothetical protein BC829DRAFT_126398 [Chytridium lagenaria]